MDSGEPPPSSSGGVTAAAAGGGGGGDTAAGEGAGGGGGNKKPSSATATAMEGWRCKLYQLDSEGQWDDKGTGFLTIKNDEVGR